MKTNLLFLTFSAAKFGLVFTLLSTNKEPLQDLLASVIDPSVEGKIEKEDLMNDDEAE